MALGSKYIWQIPSWPEFRWDSAALLSSLGDCRFQQSSLLAQMRELGFEGGMTHMSRATAQRELANLVGKGILKPNPGGGRSASYELFWDNIRDNTMVGEEPC